MKFTVIITNNTKYSIYVYICLFLRKFYSETNKSKQSWMLIQIQMYARCGNRDILLVQLSMVETYFFPHHCWVCNKILHCKAFQSLQFMKYCNKFPVFWLYVHTLPGTGWAMLHNNITKSDFLLAFFFICWKLNDVILLNKWRKRRKNSHF